MVDTAQKMNVYKNLRISFPHCCLIKRNFKLGSKKLQVETPVTGNRLRLTVKAISFTTVVGGCSFVGSMIWQDESQRNRISKKSSFHSYMPKAGSLRNQIRHYWNKLSSSQQLVWYIISLNVAIFCVWRTRKFDRIMQVWFMSNPYLGAHHAVYLPMLFSTFSHYSLLHLVANMYVLWSFSPAAIHLLGREQFLSVYITAAVVSSFVSYMNKLVRISFIPSLGASGAIMAIIGVVCTQYPNAQLSIIFLDKLYPHRFTAWDGIKGIILIDMIGCFLGWRIIDHAAHLGGMFFGMWYINYGHKYLWDAREPLIRVWHRLRGSS